MTGYRLTCDTTSVTDQTERAVRYRRSQRRIEALEAQVATLQAQVDAAWNPSQMSGLVNGFLAENYAAAGYWPAVYGSRKDVLTVQGAAPSKEASVALFNNLPTVKTVAASTQSLKANGACPDVNTIVLVGTCTSNGYWFGHYSDAAGYQFITVSGDDITSDPLGVSVEDAGLSTPAVWVVASDGHVWKNGVLVASSAWGHSNVTTSAFYLASAGSDYVSSQTGELWIFDRVFEQEDVDQVTEYAADKYAIPLA